MGIFTPVIQIIKPKSGTVAVFNNGGTGGAGDGNFRDTTFHTYQFSGDALTARLRTLFIKNGLNQTVTIIVSARYNGTLVSVPIYNSTVAAGAAAVLSPKAGGTGGTNISVPALEGPLGDSFAITAFCGTAPVSGTLEIYADWRA